MQQGSLRQDTCAIGARQTGHGKPAAFTVPVLASVKKICQGVQVKVARCVAQTAACCFFVKENDEDQYVMQTSLPGIL